jgi:predicted flap endonuclease-1-like 5' DNA nuclease
MARIINVEGIGKVYAGKLKGIGINTTDDLLAQGANPKDRQALEEKTGISGKLLLEWINHADLFRIRGVGEEYSDLLEEAGVDTIPELAQRNAANLYDSIVATNAEKHLVRRLPSRAQVADWIEQAKGLDRVIHY